MYGMAKNLVIVESPAKAKTIQGYLGKDFAVLSSFGHIRDLPKKGVSVDVNKNYEPTYEVSPGKSKTISELKKALKNASTIWLATDEDREGEAIAWHLAEALKLKQASSKRIVFHEITKSAIEKAISNPRDIDKNLVDAQQARRIIDRLVGYELSPVLWRKVRPGLSAGRVQSVAVRLIVEREREIIEFKPSSDYKISGELLSGKSNIIPVEAEKRFADKPSAKSYLIEGQKNGFTVASIDQSPGTRRPGPPLTTSTLQQEASRKLGYSVKQTMMLAQRLYEAGHITYMRTDSLNLSEQAIKKAEVFIKSKFGTEYSNPTQFKTKSKGAQEAHEAIRPTEISKEKAGEDDKQQKIYTLIRNRTLASQMSPAKIERTKVIVNVGKHQTKLMAKGETLIFPGFLKIAGVSDDIVLPELKVGDELKLGELQARETFARPPARYSESALVKKLEELGIGRPSTYAPTISTIQDRGYVEKKELEGKERSIAKVSVNAKDIEETEETEIYGADKGKLVPTPTAIQVNDFLVKHFSDILDYDFTAEIEDDLDKIADGDKKWQKVVDGVYSPFHKLVEKAADVPRAEVAQARLVGKDPKDKQPIYARYGRYGPMLQKGDGGNDDKKPTFAPMPAGEEIDSIDLQSALKAFQLPRLLGKSKEGEEISASIGRFGPYVKVGSTFVSIKDHDPYKISLVEAEKLIEEKKKKDKEKIIKIFDKDGISILKGRFGPYITDGKVNASVPKDVEPSKVSLDEAKKILSEAPAKKWRARSKPKR